MSEGAALCTGALPQLLSCWKGAPGTACAPCSPLTPLPCASPAQRRLLGRAASSSKPAMLSQATHQHPYMLDASCLSKKGPTSSEAALKCGQGSGSYSLFRQGDCPRPFLGQVCEPGRMAQTLKNMLQACTC